MRYDWPSEPLANLTRGDITNILESLAAFEKSAAGIFFAAVAKRAGRREMENVRGVRSLDDMKQVAYQIESQGKLDVLESLCEPGLGLAGALERRRDAMDKE